jgi:asparagine synthase (glutamine-hydrolysing)
MGVQFGRWNFTGKPPAPGYLERVQSLLAPYGQDESNSYSHQGVAVVYRAFHVTKESRLEAQPHVLASGAILTWDGRIDNREELIAQIGGHSPSNVPDVAIVGSLYERWGLDSLSKIIGGWALSLWNASDQTLLLARDFVGSRPLFYCLDAKQITWSSILDPLVLLSERTFALDEDYLAGWFASFPAAELTPYVGVRAVPPSCYLFLKHGQATVRPYWRFEPRKRIRYPTDGEYEEHFRVVFAESVRRCMRSDAPVLAELSGGMDSSSIVCMGDRLLSEGRAETPRLDTLSYYSDAEPNWNERPYFERVERMRGRTGCHIEVGRESSLPCEYGHDRFRPAPGAKGSETKAAAQFAELLARQKNRVLLSGIGGDEVLGGVPTALPELADLLATGRWKSLGRQLLAWALVDRRPLLHIVAHTVSLFLPKALRARWCDSPPDWLEAKFVKRHRPALEGREDRLRFFGSLPSLQMNLETLDRLRSQIGQPPLPSEPAFERRYPFLDRGLLEFLYAIPREQLLCPGQRRSLMRRALAGLVPEEILHRKRKAFVIRTPMAHLSSESPRLIALARDMVSAQLGIVNAAKFRGAVERARHGREVHVVSLLRTLAIEYWLRHLRDWNWFDAPVASNSHPSFPNRQAIIGFESEV